MWLWRTVTCLIESGMISIPWLTNHQSEVKNCDSKPIKLYFWSTGCCTTSCFQWRFNGHPDLGIKSRSLDVIWTGKAQQVLSHYHINRYYNDTIMQCLTDNDSKYHTKLKVSQKTILSLKAVVVTVANTNKYTDPHQSSLLPPFFPPPVSASSCTPRTALQGPKCCSVVDGFSFKGGKKFR